jgi:hypothetical protein
LDLRERGATEDGENYSLRCFIIYFQDKMDHVTIMGNIRNPFKIGWKYEGKRPHGRPRCRRGVV